MSVALQNIHYFFLEIDVVEDNLPLQTDWRFEAGKAVERSPPFLSESMDEQLHDSSRSIDKVQYNWIILKAGRFVIAVEPNLACFCQQPNLSIQLDDILKPFLLTLLCNEDQLL